jgi:hypothetical protein
MQEAYEHEHSMAGAGRGEGERTFVCFGSIISCACYKVLGEESCSGAEDRRSEGGKTLTAGAKWSGAKVGKVERPVVMFDRLKHTRASVFQWREVGAMGYCDINSKAEECNSSSTSKKSENDILELFLFLLNISMFFINTHFSFFRKYNIHNFFSFFKKKSYISLVPNT